MAYLYVITSINDGTQLLHALINLQTWSDVCQVVGNRAKLSAILGFNVVMLKWFYPVCDDVAPNDGFFDCIELSERVGKETTLGTVFSSLRNAGNLMLGSELYPDLSRREIREKLCRFHHQIYRRGHSSIDRFPLYSKSEKLPAFLAKTAFILCNKGLEISDKTKCLFIERINISVANPKDDIIGKITDCGVVDVIVNRPDFREMGLHYQYLGVISIRRIPNICLSVTILAIEPFNELYDSLFESLDIEKELEETLEVNKNRVKIDAKPYWEEL